MRKTDYNVLVRWQMARCNRKTDYIALVRGRMGKCNRKTDYNALVRGQKAKKQTQWAGIRVRVPDAAKSGQMGKAVFAQEPIHFQHKKSLTPYT
ncbi:hypothetical protein BK146_04420 [Paenibacillus sp. FSL R7-0333]|nr:hypothetical protein BK146_04420 [Paenibacillus sp. FSL R7-0333]